MKMKRKTRLGYGIIIIEVVLVLLCIGVLVLAYRYDCIKQENQILADMNILKMNSEEVETLFRRIDILADIVSDPGNGYADGLHQNSDNRVDAFRNYRNLKKRFDSEVSIIFADSIRKYSVIWLMDDSLKITDMFAFPRYKQSTSFFRPQSNGQTFFGKLSDYAGIPQIGRATEGFGKYCFTMPEYPNIVYIANHRQVSMTESSENFRVTTYDLGLLVFGVDISEAFSQGMNAEGTKKIEYILMDDDGYVMAADYSGTIDESWQEIRESTQKDDHLVYYSRVADGLNLFTLYRVDKSIQGRWFYLRICACVGVAMVCMGLLVATYIAKRFLKPVAALSEWIAENGQERVPDGMFKYYHTDIRHLVTQYNEHIDRIGDLFESIRRQKQREHDVEMRLLQTQINPHFIYNTFDAICYRELLKGEDEIVGILNDVSTIMRYGNNRPDKLVTLREELEMLNHYIDIEHTCYDVPIDLQVVIDENCMDINVPKLILQPLVENALLYGRRASDKSVTIRLSGNVKDGAVCLYLEDPGISADIEEINRHLSESEEILLERRKGIGTLNVHLRILRRFGEPYGLTFTRNAEKHTVVEIRLPSGTKEKK